VSQVVGEKLNAFHSIHFWPYAFALWVRVLLNGGWVLLNIMLFNALPIVVGSKICFASLELVTSESDGALSRNFPSLSLHPASYIGVPRVHPLRPSHFF
jgi:hypothetical protein